MKILLALSGGLDSAYLLWKKLTQTDDEITVVHFDMSNTEERILIKYDARAFPKEDATLEHSDKVFEIVNWMQNNVRQFTFIKEPLSAEFMSKDINLPNNPASYLTRYALNKINNNEIDCICLSQEWDNDGIHNGGTVGRSRRPGTWVALEVFKANATRGKIEFTLLDMDYNKAYALAEMPKDLLKIILHPIRPRSAKQATMYWYRKQLNEGKTPAEAGEIAKAKCIQPNGKWMSMSGWVMNEPSNERNTWDMPTWPSSYTVPSS